MRGEPVIAPSARKHGIRDDQMRHALEYPVRLFEMDEGFTMLIGPDATGRLLEIGVVEGDSALVIVHAMPARKSFLR
ncbi:MAG TPA: hypothetical protein VLR26_10950 [Frankiaceae bacterium]|nr:hypothetical protein [Frankiaceae bacterium]